jgi:hypothetical protein
MPGGRRTCTNLRPLQVIQSLERAGFLRKVAAAPGINGRPPLRWGVHPVLIGGSLAQTAETPPPRPKPTPRAIGDAIAGIAETSALGARHSSGASCGGATPKKSATGVARSQR